MKGQGSAPRVVWFPQGTRTQRQMGEGVPRLPPVEIWTEGRDPVGLSKPWTALATLLPLEVRDGQTVVEGWGRGRHPVHWPISVNKVLLEHRLAHSLHCLWLLVVQVNSCDY